LASNNKKLKIKLHAKNPNCFWCDKLTFIHKNLKACICSDTATLDHLISKNFGRNGRDLKNTVLSCHNCNDLRNSIELKLLAGKTLSPDLLKQKENFDKRYYKAFNLIKKHER
jgi:hypothetical protein